MNYSLSPEQLQHWQENHYVVLDNLFSPDGKKNIVQYANEVLSLPETKGKWMQYFEKDKQGEKQLCRIENFLDFHDGFNEIASGERSVDVVSTLMGEEAVLFKEKINVKLPGGAGFTPHQDAPAFISFKQHFHITMMIAIDEATLANGCLKIAKGFNHQLTTLPQNSDGSIESSALTDVNWQPLMAQPGDVVLFDSYVPHFSEVNTTDSSRRAIFITYSRLSDGPSRRSDYYKHKREVFPPDCEREPGRDYSKGAEIYNVANPIATQD